MTHAVTFRCNLRCRFCDVPNSKISEMSTEEVKEAMHTFRTMGCIGWGFTGGEPLLREDLVELCKFAKECEFTTSLVTNATLTAQVSKLDKRFLDFVMLSLDGDRTSMDSIRGAGTYDKVLTSLDILKKKDINVCLSTTLEDYSLDLVKHILDIAHRAGVFCSFQPIFDWNTGREVQELVRSPQRLAKYRKNVDYLIEQKKHGAPIWNSLGYLQYIRKYGEIEKIKCYAGLLYLLLDPSGVILNCWWCGNKTYYKNYKEGFQHLPRPPKDCYCFPWCHKEYSEVFSLHPRAILNTLRKL